MPIIKGDRIKAMADIAHRDWTKSDALTDADIAAQVAGNPDAAPLLGEGQDLSAWRRVRGRPRADADQPIQADGEEPSIILNIVRLRRKLGMTQAEFAKAYGFSTAAVRSIEQGKRQPSGPTKSLLALIDKDPEFVRRTLAKAEF
jgi:putative transcriptional regulator